MSDSIVETTLHIGAPDSINALIGAAFGFENVLLTEANLAPEVFDLRTGLCGELFQKLTNHRIRTALVVPDPNAYGQRFSELVFEHRAHNLIRFFTSAADARAWLG